MRMIGSMSALAPQGLALLIGWFGVAMPAAAAVKVFEDSRMTVSVEPYLRTDVVALKNTVDLDSSNSDDSTTYVGIDYSLGLLIAGTSEGPKAFLKVERNGPYDYDAPIGIHNALVTSTGPVDHYDDSDLFPQLEEAWVDLPLYLVPARLKGGAFAYQVGHGISLGGAYENYGLSVYGGGESIGWGVYYGRPDLIHKNPLGPRIEQEQAQGIDYEHSTANFFASDVSLKTARHSVQLYGGLLSDYTGEQRTNVLAVTTRRDVLGTIGVSWDVNLEPLVLQLEAARNVGYAQSRDAEVEDVEHSGYFFFGDVGYGIRQFTPHTGFLLASGNKITPEDATATSLTSGKNRAFSVFSPLNTNLADSIYSAREAVPLVAMGGGYGLNYGVNRPTTFGDPRTFDNLLLVNAGVDYQVTDRLSLMFGWWYLRSMERGVGQFEGAPIALSTDLGHELDLSCEFAVTDALTFSILSGYFLPGEYYRKQRDDTDGSLFSPFVRGDGKADRAYQIEMIVTVQW